MIKRGRKAIYSFKNMTNTIIYPVSDPGIYHHEGLGLISISADGTNWITIADKNLGATEVYNFGDEKTNEKEGGYFQWGNCYMFLNDVNYEISLTQVDTTGYGPGNYYSDNIIRRGNPRFNPNNNNLWGAETGTLEAMQGPCPTGYHIPKYTEWENIILVGENLGVWGLWHNSNMLYWNDNTCELVSKYFKMPCFDYRHYWCSDVYDGHYYVEGNYGCYNLMLDRMHPVPNSSRPILNAYTSRRTYSIRPFKNTPVQPDTSRTILYQPN